MVFLTLINFTKKEHISLGKAGEEPILGVLKQMQILFGWSFDQDMIEVCDCETIFTLGWHHELNEEDDIIPEKFIDRGDALPWKERSWESLKKTNFKDT